MGHRAGYYDFAGVLRDMFQNHLLQLLTLTAMEPTALFEADALRDEKVKVLRAIKQCTKSVRGQYHGYRNEDALAILNVIGNLITEGLIEGSSRYQDRYELVKKY